MSETTKPVAFKIEVERPEEFTSVAGTDYKTSRELCKIAISLFRPIYADLEGCTFEVDQYGRPILNLFFNHLNFSENDITAFTDKIETEEFKNETMRRIRRASRARLADNAFCITKEGREGLSEFLYDFVLDRAGKPNWNSVAVDVVQPNNTRESLTKVCYVDPVKVLAAYYGKKEGEIQYSYDVAIRSSLQQNQFAAATASKEYLLTITKIDEVQLDRALRNAGIVNPNGLGIIKG